MPRRDIDKPAHGFVATAKLVVAFRSAFGDYGLVGSRAGPNFVENRLSFSSTRAHSKSRAALANTTRNRRVTCGHEPCSIFVALPGTFRQLLSEASRHNAGERQATDGFSKPWVVGHGSRRTRRRFRTPSWRRPDESSNRCRGPVMRVAGVLDVSAVATRGARMMPGAFGDAEDGTLRAHTVFVRNLPSSNAACGRHA